MVVSASDPPPTTTLIQGVADYDYDYYHYDYRDLRDGLVEERFVSSL